MATDDSDEALMLQYRDGEVRAFEVLVGRHRRPVYNFILRFVRNPAQAEDLLQETFLRIVKSAEDYQQQARFTTWMYTIARNLCVDASRRAKHRNMASLDAPVSKQDDAAPLGDFVVGSAMAGDRHAINQQLQQRIREAVEALPDEQREIFLLREVADLQFNEIAEVLGCPENTVKSRMRYALEKLREALEEYRDLAQANEVMR